LVGKLDVWHVQKIVVDSEQSLRYGKATKETSNMKTIILVFLLLTGCAVSGEGTNFPTDTDTNTVTQTVTHSVPKLGVGTGSGTYTVPETSTGTGTSFKTDTVTQVQTSTETATATVSETQTKTQSVTETVSQTVTQSNTQTQTVTQSATNTQTDLPINLCLRPDLPPTLPSDVFVAGLASGMYYYADVAPGVCGNPNPVSLCQNPKGQAYPNVICPNLDTSIYLDCPFTTNNGTDEAVCGNLNYVRCGYCKKICNRC
jgi:hypothetical protein